MDTMPTLPVSLQKYSKLIVAVLGVLGLLLSQGLLAGNAATVVSAILAVATALGVYQVPNVTPAPAHAVVSEPFSAPTVSEPGPYPSTPAPLLGVVAPVEPAVAPVVVPEVELAVAPQPVPETQPEATTPVDPTPPT